MFNVDEIKAVLENIIAIFKEMMDNLTWFINGFKKVPANKDA